MACLILAAWKVTFSHFCSILTRHFCTLETQRSVFLLSCAEQYSKDIKAADCFPHRLHSQRLTRFIINFYSVFSVSALDIPWNFEIINGV